MPMSVSPQEKYALRAASISAWDSVSGMQGLELGAKPTRAPGTSSRSSCTVLPWATFTWWHMGT